MMNEKVKEFIDKMKEAEKADEKKKKEELLISLGLAELAVVRKYSENRDFVYDKFDDEKRLYYVDVESLVPIEITDEEYGEILKYVPIFKKRVKDDVVEKGTSIAKVINMMANVITAICVIGGLILFGVLDDDLMWLPICVLISGVIYYPFLMGFAKIVEAAEKFLKAK